MVLAGSHFVGLVRAGLRLNPLVVLVWKAIQWPTAIFFVALSCSLIYRYGPDLKECVAGTGLRLERHLVGLYGWRLCLDSCIYLHFF